MIQLSVESDHSHLRENFVLNWPKRQHTSRCSHSPVSTTPIMAGWSRLRPHQHSLPRKCSSTIYSTLWLQDPMDLTAGYLWPPLSLIVYGLSNPIIDLNWPFQLKTMQKNVSAVLHHRQFTTYLLFLKRSIQNRDEI